MYIATVDEKEAMNLKESKEMNFGGNQGRGKCYNYNHKKKRNLKSKFGSYGFLSIE